MLVYNFEGVPRNPLSVAVKNVLTLGVYTKIWLYRVNREMDGREGFHINLVTLAVMLWLPFVTPAIVKFQTAARLNQMVSDPVTIPLIRARRLGWLSLIPVFGAGFYAYWVQNSLNRFWFWHRRKERIQMDMERIKEIPEPPQSQAQQGKRAALEQECQRLEREMEEEIEAVRLKWGDEKFLERKKRADLHAKRGRLSRKEVLELRSKEKTKRKEERARRRRERSLIARYRPRRADPEDDPKWDPYTPLPRRMPDEILEAARQEDRDLSKREAKELKRAESLISAREKESARLERRRAKLLVQKRRKEARLDHKAEKKAAAGKKVKKGKKGKKPRKGEQDQQGEGRGAPEVPRRRLLVLPPQRDPEVDAHWRPRTPEPEVDPDEIAQTAQDEGRGLTKEERKQIARAEKQLERREKEEETLEKARADARAKAQKREAALEAKKVKAQGKKDKKAQKQKVKEASSDQGSKKRPVKTQKPKKGKPEKQSGKGKPEKKPKKGKPKKGLPGKGSGKTPETGQEKGTGEVPAKGDDGSSLKVLKVRCPQCRTQVPVKKRDDRPARLQCPSCGLVGKV